MREWLAWRMDQESIEALNRCTVGEVAVAAARAGDPELLRQLYPDHADCIYSPKLGRGEKYLKFPVADQKRSAQGRCELCAAHPCDMAR